MTDNAQQLNNKSASAQGAPPPHGDKEPKAALKERAEPGRFEDAKARRPARGNLQLDTNLTNQHPQRITVPKKEPRGAGTGDEANATRGRSLVEWPGPTMSHEEHVDELLTIAQVNEDFNNEQNARVFERGERTLDLLAGKVPDDKDGEAQSTPDAYESARLSYEASDPLKRIDTIKGEIEARKKRDAKRVEEMYGTKLPSKG